MQQKYIYQGMKLILILCSMILAIATLSCRKFVEIPPSSSSIADEIVFTDDNTATAAAMGMYVFMRTVTISSYATESPAFSLLTDEINNFSSGLDDEFTNNNLGAANAGVKASWDNLYKVIYTANAVLEGLPTSQGISAAVKNQLTGEARFMRALAYFYLVHLWGDVPLLTTTRVQVTATTPRTSTERVYESILSDLQGAIGLLPASYPTSEKIRVNKWAATALLARFYLYREEWAQAAMQASTVINSNTYHLPDSLNTVFIKNNPEAILHFFTTDGVGEGNRFVPSTTPTFVLTARLLQSFESGDKRRTNWVNSIIYQGQTYYYPYKYKLNRNVVSGGTEYVMELRLAEQYLIRAEANAQLNNITSAVADLNIIRTRAGLSPLTDNITKDSCLRAIEQERRIELFCERGHRWFDLKRTNRANTVLGPFKAPNWQVTDVLFPIPQQDLFANPFLTQNPGYN